MKPFHLVIMLGIEAVVVGLAVGACLLIGDNPLDLEKTWPVWLAAFFVASIFQVFIVMLTRRR